MCLHAHCLVNQSPHTARFDVDATPTLSLSLSEVFRGEHQGTGP